MKEEVQLVFALSEELFSYLHFKADVLLLQICTDWCLINGLGDFCSKPPRLLLPTQI